jgi:hypothetical protein
MVPVGSAALPEIVCARHCIGRLRRRRAPRPPRQERDAEHHPIQGDELRALRRLQRESSPSPFVFVSERAPRPASSE